MPRPRSFNPPLDYAACAVLLGSSDTAYFQMKSYLYLAPIGAGMGGGGRARKSAGRDKE